MMAPLLMAVGILLIFGLPLWAVGVFLLVCGFLYGVLR
jgi:hypothetical protein